MLYDRARHEPLHALAWDESRARAVIEMIASDAESRFREHGHWPLHPLDRNGADDARPSETTLYDGACGIIWALHRLERVRAVALRRSYVAELERLLAESIANPSKEDRASFLLGDTPLRMMLVDERPDDAQSRSLEGLIAGNTDHPARELMLGAAGTLLASLFLFERFGDARWSNLFRSTAAKLRDQLQWSARHRCSYWTQDMFGQRSTYLGAVHGFVAAALPLIRGRDLLEPGEWDAWERCITDAIAHTAEHQDGHVNWPVLVDDASATPKRLLQFCHGAPGVVVCLSRLPSPALDDSLLGAGETIWAAGPLAKGSGLCHGTCGNGYALLALYQRTRDSIWLDRARAFAMHGIAQTEEAAARHGQLRYSLWTGDLGVAVYLWDCLRAEARFPTLDVFWNPS